MSISSTPTLDPSYSPSLGSVLDNATNPAGITIGEILVDGSVGGGGAEAMAVQGFNASLGQWQYQLDGTDYWLPLDPALNQGYALALLLGSADRIRLLPSGVPGAHGDALTFWAWNETGGGTRGSYEFVTPGSAMISLDSDAASITIVQANDAPTFLSTPGTGYLRFAIDAINDRAASVSIGSNGSILLAGTSTSAVDGMDRFGLLRLRVDGALDNSFGLAGMTTVDSSPEYDQGESLAIQADGKIVVAGTSTSSTSAFVISRLNADGSLDPTFGVGGSTTIAGAEDMAARVVRIQSDGKLVIAGQTTQGNTNFQVVRLNTDGSADASFGVNGQATLDLEGGYDYGEALAIQSDGKILVGGTSMHGGVFVFSLVRLTTEGTLDAGFGNNGVAVLSGLGGEDFGESLVVLPDGRILLGGTGYHMGQYTFSVVRLNADGQLDTSFGVDGRASVGFGGSVFGESIALQKDGKLVIAGTVESEFFVARLDDNGVLDPSFGQGGTTYIDLGEIDVGRSVAIQADGKIVIAGSATVASANHFGVVRLNSDGTLDTSLGEISSVSSEFCFYAENGAPVALDAAVTIFDEELSALDGGAGNFEGASVTLSRSGGANASDLFSGLPPLTLSGASGNAVLSGVVIGTFTNTAGTLAITFNAEATQARVNSALSSLGYANSSDAPASSVQISYTFNDGNATSQGAGGARFAVSQKTVNIQSSNDGPTGSVTLDGNALVGQTLTADASTLGDADGLGALHFTWLRDGATFGAADAPTHVLTDADLQATISVRVSYTDAGGTAEQVTSLASAPVQATPVDGPPSGINTVRGTAAMNFLYGTAAPDLLLGLENSDFLFGGLGNDWLDGGEGDDLMMGGVGDDTYFVDSARDLAIEYTGHGSDTVISTVSHRLSANVENLRLAGANAINATGNDLNNTLTGNGAANTLDGGRGNDTMTGGAGDDTYVVDSVGDQVIELPDQGIDTVVAGLSQTLGDNVENLRLTGTGAFAATGNDLANSLIGNSAANVLTGGAGADTLDGAGGNDAMRGGSGDDVYFADSTADVIVELDLQGTDWVFASASYTLGANVEKLSLTGSSAISGTGNAMDNVLIGNAGFNVLSGGGGSDTIHGGLGNDALYGGAGNDTFVFDTAPSLFNRDSIFAYVASDDTIHLDNAVFTALADGPLAAGAFHQGASAHDADDRIIYNNSTGRLFYDADGAGGQAGVLFATLVGVPGAITAAEFMVI